jgi:hypothetical protein
MSRMKMVGFTVAAFLCLSLGVRDTALASESAEEAVMNNAAPTADGSQWADASVPVSFAFDDASMSIPMSHGALAIRAIAGPSPMSCKEVGLGLVICCTRILGVPFCSAG